MKSVGKHGKTNGVKTNHTNKKGDKTSATPERIKNLSGKDSRTWFSYFIFFVYITNYPKTIGCLCEYIDNYFNTLNNIYKVKKTTAIADINMTKWELLDINLSTSLRKIKFILFIGPPYFIAFNAIVRTNHGEIIDHFKLREARDHEQFFLEN